MSVKLTIDGRNVEVEKGTTILDAARRSNIYIPTLCDYRSLSPHGSCRLCIVEIEGTHKTPTSCTTPVEEGMMVRTQSAQLQSLRSELLRQLLSEHPVSCLICDEKEHCIECMVTLRKTGVTTGCRSCPKDGMCELQELVARIGLGNEPVYPVLYRNLKVERGDPFYDRDYNLCIHCGRCMRVCESLHFSGTLSYVQRGNVTKVGTAFDRNHVEAGCSFCGSCVEVCPTGALSEKTRKWDGKPEKETEAVCPLCSIACPLTLLSIDQHVVGSLPSHQAGNGHLCVKGRFGITELVSNPARLKHPLLFTNPPDGIGGQRLVVTWDEALDKAAEKLSACPPDKFGMLISATASLEDLYIGQKFTRLAMGTHRVSTPAAEIYGAGFSAVAGLLKHAPSLDVMQEAGAILCIGMDTFYTQSVVEGHLKRARDRGAKIIAMNTEANSLSMHADLWLQPQPGKEAEMLRYLASGGAQAVPKGFDERIKLRLQQATRLLHEVSPLVILIGPKTLSHIDNQHILEAILVLSALSGASAIPLPAQSNLVGSLLAGAYPWLLPGGRPAGGEEPRRRVGEVWSAPLPAFTIAQGDCSLFRECQLDVLYLCGVSMPGSVQGEPFVISQNILPPRARNGSQQGEVPQLVFPMAAFSETGSTFIDYTGRVRESEPAVQPPGEALPGWKVLCLIAQRLGIPGFEYSGVGEVRQEISTLVHGFHPGGAVNRSALAPLFPGQPVPRKPASRQLIKDENRETRLFTLYIRSTEHNYLGNPLVESVSGLRVLYPEESVCIHHQDARDLGIQQGDPVLVSTPHTYTGSQPLERIWPAWISPLQSRGTLSVVLGQRDISGPMLTPVEIRRASPPKQSQNIFSDPGCDDGVKGKECSCSH